MTEEQAEAIALSGLVWLCTQDDLLGVFLSASGAAAQDLYAALSAADGPDRALLTAALDFITLRDDTVIAAAAAQSIPVERLAHAHAVLSGAGQMHWT